MFKKTLAVILTVIMIVTCMAACSSEKKDSEKTDITVCLDWTPNTNHTGLYAALANGYYEEAGLNVTIIQPPENGATQACAAGQAQFAIDFQDILAAALASETPLEVTAVAALVQNNTSGIMSAKGQGMDSPKGLTGKTYLTWDSPIELATLENVVNSDGGDWSKVTKIPNIVTDEAQDVKQNPDHAIWVYYGWGGINAEVNNVETDFFYFKDINPVFNYYSPILVANNEFLKTNPDAAKAFLAATQKGYEYAISNPKEAADILISSDDTGSLVGNEELVYASQEWLSTQYIADAQKWGYIEPERWNAFYSWLYENNLVEKDISDNVGFSNDYLS